ncbi:membrane protein insertase YidC [Haloferula chungangensis]|uniref:Membrane protein insertase YidC n=1 Tax=Haloferula chungangensis TaxID=1048331 RepID=A0ABW2LBP2_9BACT
MYDRKTWIVVTACTVLLGLNIYFTPKPEPKAEPPKGESVINGDPSTPGGEVGVLTETPIEPPVESKTVTLETDATVFTLTSLGGGVKTAELKHQNSVVDPEKHVVLNEGESSPVGAISDGPDRLETINYVYRENESVPGQKAVFLGKHPSGLIVKKTWSTVPAEDAGSNYTLDFQLDIENSRDATMRQPLEQYSLFLGRAKPLHSKELTPTAFFWREDGSFHNENATEFKGGMFSKAKSLIVESAEEMDYVGVSSQLFATVIRPSEVAPGGVWSKGFETRLAADDDKQVLGVRAGYNLPTKTLDPGERETYSYKVFMGPKDNRMLRQMGDGWGDIMNYGWFSIFSRFMNFLLVHIHDLVSKISDKWSWGWAIILVTLLVRSLMWPLYARSNRTMKRMAKLKPEMDKLKEKYPDDPAKVQQEVMGLYRKFGINPVGGCLPMLAQIPIFFGFYRMLQYAVELRGNGFLWVDDLSMPDTVAHVLGYPLNILPIVMALSSFIQMQMMPNTSGDKTQMMIMKLMPLMFFFFCYNFASALALYWTTSNVFSIFQTWLTARMPEPELKAKASGGGKSFMEKMAAAAEQQQKMKKARGRVVEDESPKKKRGPRTGG